jgi:hypothetical protein
LRRFTYFAIVTEGKALHSKLNDGTSLSVSNFDVAGETLQKGLRVAFMERRMASSDDVYRSF